MSIAGTIEERGLQAAPARERAAAVPDLIKQAVAQNFEVAEWNAMPAEVRQEAVDAIRAGLAATYGEVMTVQLRPEREVRPEPGNAYYQQPRSEMFAGRPGVTWDQAQAELDARVITEPEVRRPLMDADSEAFVEGVRRGMGMDPEARRAELDARRAAAERAEQEGERLDKAAKQYDGDVAAYNAAIDGAGALTERQAQQWNRKGDELRARQKELEEGVQRWNESQAEISGLEPLAELDWDEMSADEAMGMLGFLGAADPALARELAPRAEGRVREWARDTLRERGLLLDAGDDEGAVSGFTAEFLKRFMAYAGAAGAALVQDGVDLSRASVFAAISGGHLGEWREVLGKWNALSRENRELARMAYGDELLLGEISGVALSWMGGANAVLRRGVQALPAVRVRDASGAVRMTSRGRPVTRRPHFQVDPLSRRGLVEMGAFDTAMGAVWGPEYIGFLAQALDLPESRVVSGLEAGTIGAVIGTAMRAGSNALLANRIRNMPEFEDLARQFESNREFMRAAADRMQEMMEAARRKAARETPRARARESESMGGEFVGDVAEGARRPVPSLRGPVEEAAPAAPGRPRAPTPDVDAGLRQAGAPAGPVGPSMRSMIEVDYAPMDTAGGVDPAVPRRGREIEDARVVYPYDSQRVVAPPDDMPPGAVDFETVLGDSQVVAVEMPLERIRLSKDLPNFKEGSDPESGVVRGQELEGEYQRPSNPIVIWERIERPGVYELVTGRHRLNLARRKNEATIPSTIVREADGFTLQQALVLDAEFNIRDGNGSVRDYAHYFRTQRIEEGAATARGLLSRSKGQAGWALGGASDALYTLYRNRQISEAKAVAIAVGASGNAGAEAVGIRAAATKTAPELELLVRNVARFGEGRGPTGRQMELGEGFGGDFQSWLDEAEKVASEQMRRINELKDQVSVGSNLKRRPEAARKMGFPVDDPDAVALRVSELEEQIRLLKNPDAEMYQELRAAVGLEPDPNFRPAPAEEVVPPGEGGPIPEAPGQVSMFGDDFGGAAAPAPAALSSADRARLVDLQRKAYQDRTISQAQRQELEALERRLGQQDFGFLDPAGATPDELAALRARASDELKAEMLARQAEPLRGGSGAMQGDFVDPDLFSQAPQGQSRASYGDAPGAEGRPGQPASPDAAPPDPPRFMLELPELVYLLRALTEGRAPKVVEFFKRSPGLRGLFRARGAGEVELRADLFNLVPPAERVQLRQEAEAYVQAKVRQGTVDKSEAERMAVERYQTTLEELVEARLRTNPEQALKTLSHEIGHVVDYLPEWMISGRGNVFGRIAGLKNFLKHTMPRDPTKPAGEALTAKDRARIHKEAKAQMEEEVGPMREVIRTILVEEPQFEALGIKPDDVKRLLGMDARETMPELYEWFAMQSGQVKKEILKAALRGMVDERVAALGGAKRQVGTRTVERQVIERTGRNPTRAEVEQRYRELLRKEILRRNLEELEHVRGEMVELSKWWRGDFGRPGTSQYAYRASGEELYADAVSVLLSNPAELGRRAPAFYEMFFNYLGNKPEVKRLYEQIQDDLRSGNVQRDRVRRLRENFQRGNDNAIRAAELAGKPTAREMLDWFGFYFDRTFGPVYRRMKADPDPVKADRLLEALEDFKYAESQFELFLRQAKFQGLAAVERAGMDWMDLAEFLFLRRVAFERGSRMGEEIANPDGWTAKQALERIDELKLEPQRYAALMEGAAGVRKAWVDNVLEPMKASGALDDDLAQFLDDNIYYATFRPSKAPAEADPNTLDAALARRFGTRETAGIFKQVGYLGDIKDPLSALLLKGRQMIQFAYRNRLAREVVSLFSRTEDPMFGPAKMHWVERGGRGFRAPVVVKTQRVGTITYVDKGKLQGYYVPRVIAEAFERGESPASVLLSGMFTASALAKSLFTMLNPGFWPWSLYWDSWGFINKMPGARALIGKRAYRKYAPRAAKQAADLSAGRPNKDADEALRNHDLISRVYYRGQRLLGTSDGERMLLSYGLHPPRATESGLEALKTWLTRLMVRLTSPAHIQERIPKLAGRMYMDEHFPTVLENAKEKRARTMMPGQKKQVIHQMAGSPDYLSKGAGAVWIDTFGRLFFNPMKEGMRSKYRQVKQRPVEAGVKFLMYTAPPALLLWAIEQGHLNDLLDDLLGPGEGEKLQEMMLAIPEDAKSNNHIIPIRWYDYEQRKVLFIRLPLEPNERALNASFRALLTQGEGGSGAIQYFGDAMPGDNPWIKTARAWWDYKVRGINPYDAFYRRNVLSQDQMEARAGTIPLLKWTSNQFLGTLVGRFDTSERMPSEPDPTGFERFLRLPIVSTTMGRWVRISNMGLRDEAMLATKDLREHHAKLRLAGWDIVRRLLDGEALSDSQQQLLASEPYLHQWINRKGREMHQLHEAAPHLRILLRDARSNLERIEILKRFSDRLENR